MRSILARALSSPALWALLLGGCGDSESSSGSSTTTTTTATTTGTGGAAPIPDSVINEQTTHEAVVTDEVYPQEKAALFRTVDVLPDLDVRSLVVLTSAQSTGDLYAGTATGLAFLPVDGPNFSAAPVTGAGAVIDLAAIDDTHLALARADGVEMWTAPGPGEVWPADAQTIACVALHGGDVYVGTEAGLSIIDAAGLTPVPGAQGFAIRDLAVNGDVVWMATAAGVKRFDVAQNKLLADLAGAPWLLDDDVRALTATSDGKEVLAATATGLSHLRADGGQASLVPVGKDALPNGDLRAVAESGGVVFTGHGIGATAMNGAHTDHYHSLRWIPDEEVTAVALADNGSRFVGTHAGLSRIVLTPRTLADKAAEYELDLQANYWRMDGIVSDEIAYDDPWSTAGDPHLSDFDNDGLWTEMQVGAWCLAYAETKDDAYRAAASRAMKTMFLFFDVPAASFEAKGMKAGFITRSLVREDEGDLFTSKASQSNWHLQALDGKQYYWKDDTSSDEYAGHFFGIPLYYDLCADEAEKKGMQDRVGSAMGYVVDNGYQLIDLDGKPTKFGRWDNLATAVDGDLGACLGAGLPNCASSYGGGGWLNSIEILGHLLAAWHITGEERFYREYERLALDERYGDMIPMTDHTFTVTSRNQQNHSDHELASLAFFTLLRYEPDADRREKWKKAILDFYGYEKPERNALEIAVIASATDGGADFADAARTLREWPLDRREWACDNSHRKDVEVDKAKDRFDDLQFTTVLPYDEMRSMKWNGNPYAVSGGGDGRAIQGPWPYLLPYWMLVHVKALTPP